MAEEPLREDIWIFSKLVWQALSRPPTNSKLLSWNCRGIGNPKILNFLSSIVKNFKPSCLLLMEPKCKKLRMESICHKLGFRSNHIIEANGLAGGLSLMWNEEINLEIEWSTKRIICCRVT